MSIYFCPWCGNMLNLLLTEADMMAYVCRTCPYTQLVTEAFTRTVEMKPKEVDDVLGGQEAWKDCPTTETVCPNCSHDTALYHQIQTRSADEPMTIFYMCCKCTHRWKE